MGAAGGDENGGNLGARDNIPVERGRRTMQGTAQVQDEELPRVPIADTHNGRIHAEDVDGGRAILDALDSTVGRERGIGTKDLARTVQKKRS